ncbi:hypothetical protein P376_6028 [Streptomyces sp. HCCB10043]|nr:hypothetical protein P376_6028 [Streptomyces sp. HCCB10043]
MLHGVGEAGAGHLGDLGGAAEFRDQSALVGAAGGGRGGPDGDGAAARGRGLDRGDRADDRQGGLQLGADRRQGVDRSRVAGDDQRVGALGRGCAGDVQGQGGQVLGGAGAPGHRAGVGGEHQFGVGPQAAHGGRCRQQADSGVHERDLHPVTLADSPCGPGSVRQTSADERRCLDRRGFTDRVGVAAAGTGLLLADGPAAPPAHRPGTLAVGGGGGAGPRRGRDAAGEPAVTAGPGLSGGGPDHPRRRLQQRRHRAAGPGPGRPVRRSPADRGDARGARAGLDGQAVGPAARDRGGPAGQAGLPAADRRGHRARAGQPARSGGRGRSRRSRRIRPRVADGAAAGGERLGAPGGPRVRLLLRAALPVPPGQQRPVADGRGGGGLCPAAYGGRRAGPDPGVDPAGGDRRRVAGAGGAAQRGPDLAGARGAGGQCAAVSAARGSVADGRAQRVRAVAAQSAAAGGDGPGAAARLCGAARDAGGGGADG